MAKYNVDKMPTDELIAWVSGWKKDSEPYLHGIHELQRRSGQSAALRAWVAIGVSVVSLAVAVSVAVFK